jgi:spore coat polysaccharide biosynthesis protein SpsF
VPTVAAILQARTSSRRLPGKVLLPLLGRPLLERLVERIRQARRVDQLVVATSTEPSDDAIAALCANVGVACFRGSLDDVLDRFYRAALGTGAKTLARITGDCPLLDPAVLDGVIDTFERGGFDYASNVHPPTFPDGLDVEVMRFPALETAWREAKLPFEREHVTPYLYREGTQFRLGNHANDRDLSKLRWTVDNREDFALVEKIYGALYPRDPRFGMNDILDLLASHPDWCEGNSAYTRNYALENAREE